MKYLVKGQLYVRKLVEVTEADIEEGKKQYMGGDPEKIAEKKMMEQLAFIAKAMSAVQPGLEVDSQSYADATKIPEELETKE